MTNIWAWRGEARSVYGLVFPLALLVFGASLLLGFGGSFRVWGAMPSIALDASALGAKFSAEGDLERAEHEYRIAGLVYPSAMDAHRQLLAIYQHTGDHQAIVRLYRHDAALHPYDARRGYELGVALLSAAQSGEGIAILESLRQNHPRYPGIHDTLGEAYFESGRYPEAETVLREGLRSDPLSAPMHEHLAVTLERRGRIEEAEREFERAAQIDPGRTSALYNLHRLQNGIAGP